jgi:hypothetical protein
MVKMLLFCRNLANFVFPRCLRTQRCCPNSITKIAECGILFVRQMRILLSSSVFAHFPISFTKPDLTITHSLYSPTDNLNRTPLLCCDFIMTRGVYSSCMNTEAPLMISITKAFTLTEVTRDAIGHRKIRELVPCRLHIFLRSKPSSNWSS